MAIYLSPDHPDVLEFLDLRRPGGDETARCRDLFLAMWIPDLFMRRVESNEEWSFFDPSACPGLDDVWGPAYDDLYATYEREGKATRAMPARDLWTAIIRSQVETGTPYLLYKDAANRCSNQQNLGTIKCSNL
jgi:ribonucleoside-diphosphate reductase subunit M1